MVSVPTVSITDPSGWAKSELPSNENKGAEQMIRAGLYRTATDKAKLENRREKEAQRDEEALEVLRGVYVDYWKAKDKKGEATVLNEMAVINPDAAKKLKDTMYNLDLTDATMAAYHMYTAAASPDEKAQNAELKKAYDKFAMTSFPFAENVKEIMAMPYGPERDAHLMNSVKVAKELGLYPDRKQGSGGDGEGKGDTTHSAVEYNDGSVLITTKGRETIFRDPAGNILEGEARLKGLEAARQSGINQKFNEAEAAEMGKQASQNYAEIQKVGRSMADAIPDMLRQIDLLSKIETGGFEGVKLKVKQLLGVETEDEAELSNKLARNVFAQLRRIFGAQFTAREGEWLRSVEPNLWKSRAGNIAILTQGIHKAYDVLDRVGYMAKTRSRRDEDTLNYINYTKDRIRREYAHMMPKGMQQQAAPQQQGPPTQTPQPGGQAAPAQQQMPLQGPRLPGAGGQLQGGVPSGRPSDSTNALQQREKAMAVKILKDRGIPADRLRYSRSTGKYGYIDETGKVVPIELPTM